MSSRHICCRVIAFLLVANLLSWTALPLSADEVYWQHDPAEPDDWFGTGNWGPHLPTSAPRLEPSYPLQYAVCRDRA